MYDDVTEHLRRLYGMNPDVTPMAFQFPRLPPSSEHPAFRTFENPVRVDTARSAKFMNKRLNSFQHMYQRHASQLLKAGPRIVPPDHPLYAGQDIAALKTENDKLLQENASLRKRLEDQTRTDQSTDKLPNHI